jgi:hypothetical protein
MKKKSQRVPDFSTKKPLPKGAPVQTEIAPPVPPSRAPSVKPPATSSKSGRRGT